MKRREVLKRTAAVGAVALTGTTAGCLGDDEEGELTGDFDEDEFDTFLDDVQAATTAVETFRITQESVSTVDDQTVTVEVSGKADHGEEAGYIEMDMSASGGPLPPGQPTELAMYIDGTTAYVDEGRDDEWSTAEPDQYQELWEAEDILATEPLYQYGSVEVDAADDTITVTTELDGNQLDAALEEMDEHVRSEFDHIDFDELTMVEHFDAETYHLVEAETEGVGEMDGEDAEINDWRQLSDINEELDASVPDEVREGAEADH